MKRFFVAMVVVFTITQTMAEDTSRLVSSDDLVGHSPKKQIVGPLGFILGKYITIEGKPCSTDATGKIHFLPPGGTAKRVHMLQVLKVNGVMLKVPVIINLSRSMKSKPTSYYVIRGYQTGRFTTAGIDSKYPNMDDVPKVPFQLTIEFKPTEDLTDYNEKKTNK